MAASPVSPFKMIASQITDFNCVNLMLAPCGANEIQHALEGSCSAEHAGGVWRGHIAFRYQALWKPDDEIQLQITVQSQSFFEYTAEDTKEEKARFEHLLKTNGAIAALAILRTNTHVTANTLGVRVPILIPNINLKEFVWKTDP